MLKDAVDFVRQGANIAMAMVMIQQPEARLSDFRKHLAAVTADKHEAAVCKMGAILAAGILDAGASTLPRSLARGHRARVICPQLRCQLSLPAVSCQLSPVTAALRSALPATPRGQARATLASTFCEQKVNVCVI
jgi:hypothetical protein